MTNDKSFKTVGEQSKKLRLTFYRLIVAQCNPIRSNRTRPSTDVTFPEMTLFLRMDKGNSSSTNLSRIALQLTAA